MHVWRFCRNECGAEHPMTTSDNAMNPSQAYVWVWLPGAQKPVVAGRLDQRDRESVITFTYGRSYLNNPDALPLFLPDLPLQHGEQAPLSGTMAGCIADASPDAWGRRVIERRHNANDTDLSDIAYLLLSGSDRIGALDFQASPVDYLPRTNGSASLDDLAEAAGLLEDGEPLPEELGMALVHGTSIGGARPKAILDDSGRGVIAKFSSSTDTLAVVKGEFVAMELARRAGVDVASVELVSAAGRDALLVERFDREPNGERKMMVSALSILNLHDAWGIAGRYATYADLADQIRRRFTEPDKTLRELFGRITFNVLVGNTDDHAKNHAAFWNGETLRLTPAYDVCPQLRSGNEAQQAMAYGPNGERDSQLAKCLAHAAVYHLDPTEATDIAGHQIAVIRDDWSEVCDLAQMPEADRNRLWGRQFLNEHALRDWP